jgi:chromosome segregation protein
MDHGQEQRSLDVFVEKLTLFGFKSYNQRIALQFDSGISGIIGPNGCGKSNVVDALRWVLGEQSTKQLRGTKMEDVIFNGTRDEKPLSLAEVELVLNNDRGRLPVDYTTVSVARRLYRSGISEYFINKQPVRLKDVRDLFMDTGMGSHAYSVIERQMVDNILSDTTGHRRFLFEEAAGIMKYKTRKKEALGKLEATERDLLRVNDIIAEIDRQVASLRRQVGKAQRYRELLEEAKSLDLAFSAARRAEWLCELADVRSRHAASLRTAESGETEVATLEARLEALHLAVLEKERALAEAREALAEVDDAIGRENSRIIVLRERLQSTRDRIREAEEHKVRLTERQARNAESQEATAARLAALAEREIAERAILDERESVFQDADRAYRTLRDRAGAAKREADALRDAVVRSEAALETSERRGGDLRERRREREARLAAAVARIEEKERAEAEARTRTASRRETLAGAEEQERLVDLRSKNLTERTELLRKSLAEKREEEAAARSRLGTLEDLHARMEGFLPAVRSLMLESRRDPGMVGLLGDLVTLPREWKDALEPALSRVWQVLVVRDTASARRLVRRLGAESLGYAAILPLDRVPERPARPAGLTWAADVVSAAPEHRALVAYLLDGLALVHDLEEALRLVESGGAPRAATSGGEFVDGALVSGGKGGREGDDLIERTEALDRCRRQVESLALVLQDLAGHEQDLAAERADLDRQCREAAGTVASARAALAEAELDESHLALERRHLAADRDALVAEGDTLAGLEREWGAERADLETRLAEGRTRSETAQRAVATLEADVSAAEGERERLLTGVHELRVVWEKLQSDLRDARSAADRLAEERGQLEDEWGRTVVAESESRSLAAEIEADLVRLAETVQNLHVDRDARNAVLESCEREKSEASAVEQQDAETVREVRRRAGKARQEAHELELRLHDLDGSVRHLEARLRDEYAVEPADLDGFEERELPAEAPQVLADLKDRIRRLGPVNLLAMGSTRRRASGWSS